MKKIVLDDILGFTAYEKVREEFRREIIEKKKSAGFRWARIFR